MFFRFSSSDSAENVQFLTELIKEVESNGRSYQLPTNAREYEPDEIDLVGRWAGKYKHLKNYRIFAFLPNK